MKIIRFTLMLLVSLDILSVSSIAQISNSKLQVGKRGEIVLKEPARIGDTTLEPGTYVIQHRVIADRHYVRFQKLEEVPNLDLEPTFEPTDAGTFECKLDPASSKFKTTTVFIDHDAKGAHITKVEIKGENAIHIF